MKLKDMPNMPEDNGIEHHPGGTTFTGVGVDIFRILSLRGMMEVELAGMHFRGGRSRTAAIKKEFGLTGNKRKVYEQFCKMHNIPTIDERKAMTRAVAHTKEESK
jgi:hypothetical protein